MNTPLTPGTLYIVATPIGHWGDLTERARDVLQRADVIYAEDTRVAQTLLTRLQRSDAKVISLHAHNEASRIAHVLETLRTGHSAALISDAGTPLISDPGERLLAAVIEAGHPVSPIPGPSAVITALSACGFVARPFAFFGFLERDRSERLNQLGQIRAFKGTVVLFESKERIADTLRELGHWLGENTPAVIARELTKLYETFHRGTLGSLAIHCETMPLKGEITVVIAPQNAQSAEMEQSLLVINELKQDSRPLTTRVKELILRTGMARKEAYRALSGDSNDS